MDKIFLGHYVRPLFNGNQSPGAIRDGLNNTVVTAGVVGALVFSLTIEAALDSEPNGMIYSTIASFSWYAASGCALWSILTSTLAAVAIAITPEDRINIIGRKLLYCWVIPFETTMFSVAWMALGMWTDAERNREILLEEQHNMTGSAAFFSAAHGGIVIWSVRAFMVFTGGISFLISVIVVCCGEKVEKATGLISTTEDEEEKTERDTQPSNTKVEPRL